MKFSVKTIFLIALAVFVIFILFKTVDVFVNFVNAIGDSFTNFLLQLTDKISCSFYLMPDWVPAVLVLIVIVALLKKGNGSKPN